MHWLEANRRNCAALSVINHRGCLYPPIDIVGVAKSLGVTVSFVDGAQWKSAVQSTPDGTAEIYVNVQDRSSNGIRYEVARCLALLLQSKPGTVVRNGAVSEDCVRDIKANVYAQELLIPWPQVEVLVGRGWTNVKRLADLFQVSQEWMESRLKGLNYRVTG